MDWCLNVFLYLTASYLCVDDCHHDTIVTEIGVKVDNVVFGCN